LILTAEEQRDLEKAYGKQIVSNTGYNPNKIERIEELTAEEKIFFAQKNFISPHFSVQTLYKIQGDITPIRFNRVVHDMVYSDEIFRTNFCEMCGRTVKVIFEERRILPEVVYRTLMQTEPDEIDDTLTKIMEADRRVEFDLRHGNLIRFSIFRTNENEFAVLVTIAQLIANHFEPKIFFPSVLEIFKYRRVNTTAVTVKPEHISTAISDYWARILSNPPSLPAVPYTKPSNAPFNPKAFREKISGDILSDLREKSQSSRVMLMTILQSAWGFFLQAVRGLNDIIFCQLGSSNKSGNFAFNVIPVRQKCFDNMSVEQIITQQFRQLVVSQPYGFSDWDALRKLTKGKTFDHCLSFLDFKGTPDMPYSEVKAEPQGAVVAGNSWDSQGMKLAVYFQYAATNLSVTFLYDAHQFFANVGERLAKVYNLILRQMLVHWHSTYATFMDKLVKQIRIELEDEKHLELGDEKRIITNFLTSNPILQGSAVGTAAFFADSVQLFYKFEGDRIYGDILEENLVFVVDGKVARSLDTGDGWYRALDIISKGGWINENVLMNKKRTIISAEVLTEHAKILTIPLEKVDSLFRRHPDTVKPFLEHVLKQMEKYQLLWINS